MTATTADERTVRSHGWSPELLTVLGAVLMIGVGLAGLMLNMQGQIREDMRSLETRLRADMELMETRLRTDMELMETRLRTDMELMEKRLREDMGVMETRLREDMREIRSDVGKLRERVSHLEGRLELKDAPAARSGSMQPPIAPS